MMIRNTPWNDIKTPNDDLNVRKIKDAKNIPLYWGKDCEGHCIFLIELTGNHVEIYRKNSVSIHGIKIDLRYFEATKNQGFIITLEKHIDQDLFFSLCENLIEALADISDHKVGLSVALAQIKRWKTFMAGPASKNIIYERDQRTLLRIVFL